MRNGKPIPITPWNEEIAANGELRFHAIHVPGRRSKVFCAFMVLEDRQLILGYVKRQSGRWSARIPGRPWRGSFSNKMKATDSLRVAFAR